MSESKPKSDIWIVAGVVVCLGIGASATYLLSGAAEPSRKPKPVAVQGELINAPKDPQKNAAVTPTPAKLTSPALVPPPPSSDFLTVTFDTLGSFFYEIPDLSKASTEPAVKPAADAPKTVAKPKDQIPAPIRAFSGKRVAVQGFMVPIRIEKGATKSFLLVKDQSLCCYGRMPRMNEWVSVKMTGDKAAKFIGDQPVTVFGKIDVGEEIEKGEVLSIYRLEAEDVAGPLDL
jgi:hypothetical protein